MGGRLTDFVIIQNRIFAEFSESIRYGTLNVDQNWSGEISGLGQTYRMTKLRQQDQFITVGINNQMITRWNNQFPPVKQNEAKIDPQDTIF